MEIEFGDTDMVDIGNGWFRNKITGHKFDGRGNEYDANGNLIISNTLIKKDDDESGTKQEDT